MTTITPQQATSALVYINRASDLIAGTRQEFRDIEAVSAVLQLIASGMATVEVKSTLQDVIKAAPAPLEETKAE